MADRQDNEYLEKLKANGAHIYSISRVNTIDQCMKQAWYSYVGKIKGEDNIYGIMGTKIHDTLEKIFNFEAKESDLLPALKEELAWADSIGVDFPKDFKGGTSIRDSWIADMANFCISYEKPEGEFFTERLITYKLAEDRYLIGYIDLIEKVDDNTWKIIDFKTSSEFKKDDLLHHGRQLVVYKLALQNKLKEEFGIDANITTYWNMLKYVKVGFEGFARTTSKKPKHMEKVIHRGKLIKELEPHIRRKLEDAGHEDFEIDYMLEKALEINSMIHIPKEIADQFDIEPFVLEYEVTPELEEEAINYINSNADKFEQQLAASDKMEDWESFEIDKKSSFFCNALCSYRKMCPAIKKYNDLLELDDVDLDDLF